MSYRATFKRLFDVVVALLLLAILSPLLLIGMTVLFFANRGSVFFMQTRPGKNGKPFRIIKLKTMRDGRDENGLLLPDEQRLHWAGKIVRKLSVDEIPQLTNVLKGDMSLVGPRPLLMEYLPLYNTFQSRRHEQRPGITGWAQVNGRNNLSWEEKFKHDVWYVDHLSFSLDMKILWMTILKVLKADGVSGEGTITMTKFEGNGQPGSNLLNEYR